MYTTNEQELIEFINKTIDRKFKNSHTLDQVKREFDWNNPKEASLKILGVTLSQFHYIKGWIQYIKEYNAKMINLDYRDTLGNVIKVGDWVLLFNKNNNPAKWSVEKVVDNNGVLCTIFSKVLQNIYTDLRTISPNHLVIITAGGENQIFSNDTKLILK